MAYRNPEFGFLHAAADAGVGAITTTNALLAGFPKDHLIDRRPSSLATFAGFATTHDIRLDRGAAGLEAVDRLLIPAGHNLDTATSLQVEKSTTGAFAGEESVIGFLLAPPAGQLEIDLSPGHTERHLRLKMNGSGKWSLGQLWYTRRRAMAEASPATPWEEPVVVPARVRQTPTRRAASILGAPRRRYRWRYVGVSGADQVLLDELRVATSNGARAFWVWPAESTEAAVLVEGGADGQPLEWRREQDHPGVQAFGPSYTWDLDLLEVTA